MKNLKDSLTTIAGLAGAIAGAILLMPVTALPAAFFIAAKVAVPLSVAIIGYLSGKNPDGSPKTPDQIDNQLNPK